MKFNVQVPDRHFLNNGGPCDMRDDIGKLQNKHASRGIIYILTRKAITKKLGDDRATIKLVKLHQIPTKYGR